MNELRGLGDISLPFALDIKGNYIYIRDAYRESKYYCPCCGKEVNTIAIGDEIDYKMPPHYRHYPHQSCTGESLAHWVYKMWLFDKDSQFYVSDGSNKTQYTVKSINIEKTYKTDYGDYRPDLTIITTCDKTFYFELNFSSPKRSDDYFCKWSQLNNNVIEVDVKKLLKESLNNKIPIFRLIFSDGVCFDDKYNKRDAFANAANKLSVRKLEIKRQDILNYKTVWEKLDWFFDSIKKYKAMKSTMDDILNSFGNVPFEEKEKCFEIVKRLTCINNNQAFRDIMNDEFETKLIQYINNLCINLEGICTVEHNYEIRKGCHVGIYLNKKYSILNKVTHYFKKWYENRKWQMSYTYFQLIKSDVDKFFLSIPQHIKNVDLINSKINWNRYPLLFSSLCENDDPYIDNNEFANICDLLIQDHDSTIELLNERYIDYVVEYRLELFKENLSNCINETTIYLNSCFKELHFSTYKSYCGDKFYININDNKMKSNYNRTIDKFVFEINSCTVYMEKDDVDKLLINISKPDMDFIKSYLLSKVTNKIIPIIEEKRIKEQIDEIRKNKINELLDSEYCKQTLCRINEYLCANYYMRCSLTTNVNVMICYENKVCQREICRSEIGVETLYYLISNECLYDYILNDLSKWIQNTNVIDYTKMYDFVHSFDFFNNNTWNLYHYFDRNNDEYINIKLSFINPSGFKKYDSTRLFLDTIRLFNDVQPYETLKKTLANTMDSMLNKQIDFYNNKYKDALVLRKTGGTNDK